MIKYVGTVAGVSICVDDYPISLMDEIMSKSMTTELRLFDDASTRKKYEVMEKLEIMADDNRNADMKFWFDMDDFIQWGKLYKLTIEEISE